MDHNKSPVTLRQRIHPVIRLVVIPLISVFLSIQLKQLFPNVFGGARFLLFYLPVLICAWVGGLYAGIIATILSAIAILFFFPYQNTGVRSAFEIINAVIYCGEGVAISFVVDRLYSAREDMQRSLIALQHSEERYKLLVENAKEFAIFMINPSGKIISWNSGAKNLLGFTEKGIIGKKFVRFYTIEDKKKKRPKKELEEAFKTGRAVDNNWAVRKNGKIFWASGLTMPVLNAGGKLIAYEKILRDATELKEQQMKRDDFISIATHELRTPVTSMNAYFSVLQKRLERGKNFESLQLFEKVKGQLDKLNVLIADLPDISRIQGQKLPINKEYIRIDDIVKDTVQDMRQSTKTHTIAIQGKAQATVYADKSRINQILRNLISNAIKYSPEGKKVIVSCQVKEKFISIGVKDFGPGIRKEDQKKIFDRFYRVQPKNGQTGLGLGLFIAREIASQHRGDIVVESTFGKGSTFFLKLPLSQKSKKRYSKVRQKGR